MKIYITSLKKKFSSSSSRPCNDISKKTPVTLLTHPPKINHVKLGGFVGCVWVGWGGGSCGNYIRSITCRDESNNGIMQPNFFEYKAAIYAFFYIHLKNPMHHHVSFCIISTFSYTWPSRVCLQINISITRGRIFIFINTNALDSSQL